MSTKAIFIYSDVGCQSNEMKTYLGISMLVMIKGDVFAHKLMEMIYRTVKTSRDFFGIQFFAKNGWLSTGKL